MVEIGDLNAVEAELGVRPVSYNPGSNWGTLMLDTTCILDGILYTVDLRLLNISITFSSGVECETTELVIDKVFSKICRGKHASCAATATNTGSYFLHSS